MNFNSDNKRKNTDNSFQKLFLRWKNIELKNIESRLIKTACKVQKKANTDWAHT